MAFIYTYLFEKIKIRHREKCTNSLIRLWRLIDFKLVLKYSNCEAIKKHKGVSSLYSNIIHLYTVL